MGFGKLADLFFWNGYMSGVNSSQTQKINFVYILLGLVRIAFLTVSITQEFTAFKIAVLVVLLLLQFYGGRRRKLG